MCSNVPNSILIDSLKNNPSIKVISICKYGNRNLIQFHIIIVLSADNNLNVNTIAETIGEHNRNIEEIYFSEKQGVNAKGMKTFARCNKLRILEITGGPYQCDPEDSLQYIAAGCPLLERSLIVLTIFPSIHLYFHFLQIGYMWLERNKR